jgi:sterol desaturase/sphingolipid hydroxylase (fatty acid hydroxylase superfamily)
MPIILGGFATLFSIFAIWEWIAPRQAAPKVAHWRLKCAAAIACYFAISFGGPLMWDATIAQHALFNAAALPFWVQVLGGFLAYEAGVYAWHRTMHMVDPLWRHVHQAHHSAERLDVWGAFWFHPLDVAGFSLVGSLALVGAFGVSLEAAITLNLIALFCNMFQHANIRTPHWMGYLIQRPESHAIHHQRGVHRYNYGDVPWFDMLFGTFRNPDRAPEEAGFFDGASSRLWSLLIGRKLA